MSDTFKVGDLVTWGSGDIRGAVMDGYNSHRDEHEVELVRDYKSPCGRIWPAGKRVTMPALELRHLQ